MTHQIGTYSYYLESMELPLQNAVVELAYPAYCAAVAAHAPGFYAVPIVIPTQDPESAVVELLSSFNDTAESDALGVSFAAGYDQTFVLMHSDRCRDDLLNGAQTAMTLWRLAEMAGSDPGLFGPLIAWEPLLPALCDGVLPEPYRRAGLSLRRRPALHTIDLLRMSAASFLHSNCFSFVCLFDQADDLRHDLEAAGASCVRNAEWMLDRTKPYFSFHDSHDTPDRLRVVVTLLDTAWDAFLDMAEDKYSPPSPDSRGLPIALQVPGPPGIPVVRLRISIAQSGRAEEILRRCGGRKSRLDGVFSVLGSFGLRFGTHKGKGENYLLIAAGSLQGLEGAIEALAEVDFTRLPVLRA
ncbi:hypothetical protein [Falsiroseomonas sp. E2-1-a20]|uniref:hypothetical protein n=1 Tax=Falsiroseomonas sp. E2-1-a20 TaxID=3239300 RepID=UPI003F39D1EF